MIAAASIDDLPDHVPALAREALALCKKLDAGIFAEYQWRHMPTAIVLRLKVVKGILQASAGPLGQAGVARALSAELRDLIYYRVPRPQPGEHVGTAAVSEGAVLDAGVELPRVTGRELAEAFDDLVAAGKARSIRSTLVVLSSGWRCEYRRSRAGNTITIGVHEPGDEWDCEESRLLATLDAKLLGCP